MSLIDSAVGTFAQHFGMATKWLREQLATRGVTVPLSAGCLEEFAKDAHHAAERSRVADEPYVSCLQRQLESRARFIELWTTTDEAFDRKEWSELVAIARKYAIPRAWKLSEPVVQERSRVAKA